MARVLVDTSAILALLVSSEATHQQARRIFERLRSQDALLTTTSYVLLETYALLGRRMGLASVREFREAFSSLLEIIWVDHTLHERGLNLLLESGIRDLSLVDTVSFILLRELEIEGVFAFDRHFTNQGFSLLH